MSEQIKKVKYLSKEVIVPDGVDAKTIIKAMGISPDATMTVEDGVATIEMVKPSGSKGASTVEEAFEEVRSLASDYINSEEVDDERFAGDEFVVVAATTAKPHTDFLRFTNLTEEEVAALSAIAQLTFEREVDIAGALVDFKENATFDDILPAVSSSVNVQTVGAFLNS